MEEVEKKARVTEKNQQLIFRGKSLSQRSIVATFAVQGQRLHLTPDAELEKFALFNGNQILLIGEKVSCWFD